MATVSYTVAGPLLKWVIKLATERISSLSKETVRFTVFADSAGLVYDPRADTVEFAFIASGANPTSPDWHAGAWDVNVIGTYTAGITVGTGGAVALAIGEYYAWCRITDATAGEIVVRNVGKLIVQ